MAWGNNKKGMHYSFLSLKKISFLLFTQASEPSMNFSVSGIGPLILLLMQCISTRNLHIGQLSTVARKNKTHPLSKTRPRIQSTSQNPKTRPRIPNTSHNPKNTSQNPKTLPGTQNTFRNYNNTF